MEDAAGEVNETEVNELLYDDGDHEDDDDGKDGEKEQEEEDEDQERSWKR